MPLVAASILSPSALSSTTLTNRAALDSTAGVAPMPSWNAASKESAQKALDSDPNQPVPVEVTDLITLSKQPAQMKAFDGRKVKVVAQVLDLGGKGPKAVRWIMWCCAADAQPAAVALSGKVGGPYKDSDWLELTGTARFPSEHDHATPQIEVDAGGADAGAGRALSFARDGKVAGEGPRAGAVAPGNPCFLEDLLTQNAP